MRISCLAIAVLVGGCAAARSASPTSVTPTASVAPATRGRVSLAVHDPTDLEARLSMLLGAALAKRGIQSVQLDPRGGHAPDLIVEVTVLNRTRSGQVVQSHDWGSRPATGIGLVSGSDDPEHTPEQHDPPSERFDFGRSAEQTDLRMIVTASLRQTGISEPLAKWTDQEGTLVRRSDGPQPAVNPWQAVYAAMAQQLADQVAAALARRAPSAARGAQLHR